MVLQIWEAGYLDVISAPSSTRTQISLLGTATLFRAALSPVGSSTKSQTSALCPVPDPLPVSTARLASGSLSNSSGEDDRQGCAAEEQALRTASAAGDSPLQAFHSLLTAAA